MQTKKQKQIRKHSRLMEGLFSKNPILVGGLGLPFAIMLTYNLKNSLWVSIVMAAVLIPTVLLAYLVGHYLPRWVLMIVCALFAMAIIMVVVPVLRPYAPEVFDALGVYLYLVALNSFLGTLCCRHGLRQHKALYVLTDALSYSLGFAAAVCTIGSIREILGNGTLWGVSLDIPFKLGGMQIAFSGFLVVGMLGGMLQWLRRVLRVRHFRQDNPAGHREVKAS